jgi:hypothetical protein
MEPMLGPNNNNYLNLMSQDLKASHSFRATVFGLPLDDNLMAMLLRSR